LCVCYITTMSVPSQYSVDYRMINEHGAVRVTRIGMRNLSNPKKPTSTYWPTVEAKYSTQLIQKPAAEFNRMS
jgi:hypothetical protein